MADARRETVLSTGRDYNDAGSSDCDSIAPESHSQQISDRYNLANVQEELEDEMLADDLDEGASANMLRSQ